MNSSYYAKFGIVLPVYRTLLKTHPSKSERTMDSRAHPWIPRATLREITLQETILSLATSDQQLNITTAMYREEVGLRSLNNLFLEQEGR
ncbi:MAG: hypothetical protein JRI70_08625 [Deltaproteobacteria bacterium]|nr:hypothetical protein [Deltaproteobacteria bacterium]